MRLSPLVLSLLLACEAQKACSEGQRTTADGECASIEDDGSAHPAGGDDSGEDGTGDDGDDFDDDDDSHGDDFGDDDGEDSGDDSGGGTYVGGWPIDAGCADLEVTGDAVGEVTAATAIIDQRGQEVNLHDFCQHAVLIAVDATWDPFMVNAIENLEAQAELHPDGLVVVLDIMENSSGGEPTEALVADLADDYDLDLPVLADADRELFERWGDSYIPLYVLLAPGAEVVAYGWDAEEILDEVADVVPAR